MTQSHISRPRWPGTPVAWLLVLCVFAGAWMFTSAFSENTAEAKSKRKKRSPRYVVLGFNDLGMHCMNQDFSEICILPPFNTLQAQVIDRSDDEPHIVTEQVRVLYSIPGNTTSTDKTNFWDYAPDLFGVDLPPDIGLTGNGLFGRLQPGDNGLWAATGIPVTPWNDQFENDPFQLAEIVVKNKRGNKTLAKTEAVVPVSWEINCNLCHDTPGISVATDILRKHDTLHGTNLEQQKPVLCASCHADPALGTAGVEDVPAFSHAMHGSHASRMDSVSNLTNACYACHPGVQTECQRDVHLPLGITCVECHGDMEQVADVGRVPWVDEPTCAECHNTLNPQFEYEEPGKLFKDSKGHGGIFCASCHGPQHAVGPAVTDADNVQAILQQGHAGVISNCKVCHSKRPDEPFFHSRDESENEEEHEEEDR